MDPLPINKRVLSIIMIHTGGKYQKLFIFHVYSVLLNPMIELICSAAGINDKRVGTEVKVHHALLAFMSGYTS